MAKSTDAAPINEESVGFLEDVKKGKPRKFAMICKGAQIVSLVVYKKGTTEKYKKQAKEAGKGQFYFGVVDGKGVNVGFKLARADGFDKEPVKTSVLKQFLNENAGIQFKPVFEIVDALGPVLDADDPLVARYLRLQEATVKYCGEHPAQAAYVNGLCAEIGVSLDQDLPDQATAKIAELESILGTSKAPPPPSPPPKAPPPPPSSTPDDMAAKFTARLKEIKPLLEKVLAGGSAAAEEIKLRASEMGGFARKKEFAQAGQLLDQIVHLIKEAVGDKQSFNEQDFQKQWKLAQDTWRTSVETVDGQINQVRAAMLNSGIPQLKAIADRGLAAVTENHKTPVMKAILEVSGSTGPARQTAAAKGLAAISNFRRHLESDPRISALDADSQAAFGVPITIRDEIGRGLDALDRALRPIVSG